MSYYDEVKEAADAIRSRVRELPLIAIVLGSGLGEFTKALAGALTCAYGDIPHWPASAVVGHAGQLVVGTIRGKRVAALSVDTEIRFRSAVERAAFTDELAAAVTGLVARYHDASAPGGRVHRLVAVAHPLPQIQKLPPLQKSHTKEREA